MLKVLIFPKAKKIRYDPHHIISNRRQQNKNDPYDHQTVEGIDKIANLESFKEGEKLTEMQEDVGKVSSHTITIQTIAKVELLNKRVFSETIEMEVDGE